MKSKLFAISLVSWIAIALGVVEVHAAIGTWIGGNGNWSDSAHWSGGVIPGGVGDTARILGGSSATVTLDIAPTIGSLIESGTTFGWSFQPASQQVIMDVPSGHALIQSNNGGLFLKAIFVLHDSLDVLANRSIFFDGGDITGVGDVIASTGTATSQIFFAGLHNQGSVSLAVNNFGPASGINNIGSSVTTFTKSGVGSATIGGLCQYVGGSLVNGGQLTAINDHALGMGDVSVSAATLVLKTGTTNDYIADTAALNLSSGGTANLSFTGTDTISAFSVDGILQAPGIWGAVGSGVEHESARLTGTGTLTVIPEPSSLTLVAGATLILGLGRRRNVAR